MLLSNDNNAIANVTIVPCIWIMATIKLFQLSTYISVIPFFTAISHIVPITSKKINVGIFGTLLIIYKFTNSSHLFHQP